ncbi:MAG TPA: PQQ-binding-like beta-propeller repeat protein [Phycisphaerae bacterium]|nr:PQQ-binding-like beta-propeller repeat protein [Phycisphaerae bacterium]
MKVRRAMTAWVLVGITLAATAGFVTLLGVVPSSGEPAAAGADGNWPQWRGPNRDGISSEAGWSTSWPMEGPPKVWRASVGQGYSSISVAAGRAYTMGNAQGRDVVYCFDAAGGKELWKYSYQCAAGEQPGTRVTPTVDGDRVYTLSREGHLFCLSADKGKKIWSAHMVKDFGAQLGQWGLACSPLILGDRLIVDAGITVAFDKKTGKVLWKSEKQKAGYATPAVFQRGDKQCLAVFRAFAFAVLDLADGRTVYSLPWKTDYDVNAATPIFSDGKVFISSGYGTGCALIDVAAAEPKVLWKNRDMKNHCNTCILWEGHLYGFDGQVGGGGTLTCMEFQTGKVKWSQRGLGTGALMMADGKLIVLAERGDLVIAEASPEKFQKLAQAKVLGGTCWTYPVLAGGRIYCRNDRGDLVCLDVRKK